jgi:DeoR/GlpR family transcriptional regulator of sugar metabolism
MKNNRARIQARRNEILLILRSSSHVSVRELAEKFQVSLLTIRRDLQFLENEHKLERFYGGAASVEEDRPSAVPDETSRCRDQIARYAASLVEDDDTVFINTSSTALRMIPHITASRVTVITNNGKIMEVPWPADMSVILTGGELRRMVGAMTGEFAISTLSTIMAKKSFLGCDGLSADNGATTEILNAANVNRLMMERVTGAAYILADHSKIGRKSSFVSCPPGQLANIITDEFADPEELERLRERNIEVTQVRLRDLY